MTNPGKIDYLLQHITSLLARDTDQILLEQLGVGYAQYKLLRILNKDVPVKQRYIASVLGQTEASISRQIDLMIDKKLIIKSVDPVNKRIRLITITLKGKRITEAINKLLDKTYKDALKNLSNKQQNDLLSSLETLHKVICSSDHSPSPDYLTYLIEN